MSIFRRLMLAGNNIPEDWIIRYIADSKVEPSGFNIISSTFNTETNEGKIVNNNTITSFPQGCFNGTKIKTIDIPNSVTTLERQCLSNTQLTELNIPDSVITVGTTAAQENSNLIKIVIGKNVETLKSGAFNFNPNLEEVYFMGNNIKEIGDACFYNNPKLKKIIVNYMTFPETLADKVIIANGSPTINGAGFYLYGGSLIKDMRITGNVNAGTYENCYGLKTVSIKDVSNIGGAAFKGVTTEDWFNITCYFKKENCVIGHSAFAKSDLQDIVLNGHNFLEIGDEAFYLCKKLQNFSVDALGTVSIGARSFFGCSSLTYLRIYNVLSIKSEAFRNCTSMKKYYFEDNTVVPTLESINAFEGIPSTCKIVVPDSLYDEWVAAENWSTYASQIVKVSED